MKKAALVCGILGLLLLLIGAGAWWWLFGRPIKPITAADHLPSNTIFLAEIPDGTRSWLRWQQTTAKKWVEHPEMKAVWALAASALAQADLSQENQQTAEKALSHLAQAASGLSFVALTDLPASDQAASPLDLASRLNLIAGFHGGQSTPGHIDAFFAEIEKLFQEESAKLKRGTAQAGGITYHFIELEGLSGIRFCHARHPKWELFSLGEAPLKSFLESLATGSAPDRLALSPAYRDTIARLNPTRDGHLYLSLPPFIDLYLSAFSTLSPEMRPTLEESMKLARNFTALGWDIHLNGGEIRERVVIGLTPGSQPAFGSALQPVALESLRFTREGSTLLYSASNVDWEKNYDQQRASLQAVPQPNRPEGSPPLDPFELMETQAKAMGIDVRENILRAIGPEFALILDWPEQDALPEVAMLVGIQDASKFAPAWAALEGTLRMMAVGFGHAEDFEAGGLKGLTVHVPQAPMISPTVATGNNFMLMALSGPGAKRLAAGEARPWTREMLSPGSPLPPTTTQIMRGDTATLLSRSYVALRPILQAKLATASHDQLRAWSNQLPEKLESAALLGIWSSHSFVSGDWFHTEFHSPLGSMILPVTTAACAAAAGFAAFHKADPAPSPAPEPESPPELPAQDQPEPPTQTPDSAPAPAASPTQTTPAQGLPEIFDTPPPPAAP